MGAPASRRGLFLGLAVLPFAGRPAIAAPPSDLASACDWAVRHLAWINTALEDDAEIEVEVARTEAVIVRAIREPSASVGDLAAKARLILDDLKGHAMMHSEYNDDRLIVVVLREAASLTMAGEVGR